MEIHQEFDDLCIVSVRIDLVHPLKVFIGNSFVSGVFDALEIDIAPESEFALDLDDGVFQFILCVNIGGTVVDAYFTAGVCAEVFFKRDTL